VTYLDIAMLVLTILGVGLSGLAAWAAIKSVTLTRAGLAKQEEQLRIERGLASMVPKLEVSDVRFTDTRRFEEVADTLQEREEAIRKEREETQRAEERRRREEQRRNAERELQEGPSGGSLSDWLSSYGSGPFFEMDLSQLSDVAGLDPYTLEQRDYRGPEPDAVMQIVLKNVGLTAAVDITGSVTTNANHGTMLSFPGLDVESVTQPGEGSSHTAELGTISELLPGRSEAFRIAVVAGPQTPEEEWSLKYQFITPSGHGVSGTWRTPIEGSPDDQ